MKVFSEERTFNSSKGELLPTLKAMAKSEISNLRSSKLGKMEPPIHAGEANIAEQTLDLEGGHIRSGQISEIIPEYVDPLKAVIDCEDDVQEAARIDQIYAALEGDPELSDVVDTIQKIDEDEPKPHQIAEKLGIPTSDVQNRIKRLKRKLRKFSSKTQD